MTGPAITPACFARCTRAHAHPPVLDVRYIPGIYYTVSEDMSGPLARCTGFQWDTGNAPKVLERHGVGPGECEQAFFVEPFLLTADPAHSAAEARWRALGQTLAGRTLHIVFTVRGDLIRVIAARDMSRKERQVYEQAKARIEKDSGLQD